MDGIDRARVQSIFTPNVRYLEVVEDGIEAGNVIPADFTPTPEKMARVRDNIRKAGILGRLVANDFSGALVSAIVLDQDAQGRAVDPIAGGAPAREPRASRHRDRAGGRRRGHRRAHHRLCRGDGEHRRRGERGAAVRGDHHRPDAARGALLLPVLERRLACRCCARWSPSSGSWARSCCCTTAWIRSGCWCRSSSSPSASATGCRRSARSAMRPLRASSSMDAARRTFRQLLRAGDRGAACRPGRLRHHPADPGAGDPRDGRHRQHRRADRHPHRPGAAAGAGLLRAFRRRATTRASSAGTASCGPVACALRG